MHAYAQLDCNLSWFSLITFEASIFTLPSKSILQPHVAQLQCMQESIHVRPS